MANMLLRHKQLLEQDREMFGKRGQLMELWQETAENFYPERADFTNTRTIGETFAGSLDTSYPILARRELGQSFSAMLRPTQKVWAHTKRRGTEKADKVKEEERAWLEAADMTQRRALYDRISGFVRATNEGDHDFAAFGQCVISSEIATTPIYGQILLHRSHHLRDMAWMEDTWGQIGQRHRKMEPTARQYKHMFPGRISKQAADLATKDPFKKVQVRHCVLPAHEYEFGTNAPWVSVYIEVDFEHVVEEVGTFTPHYIIPRWQTVSGSQYAYSPATVAALPDARLLQAMTYTLLTAGEKAVDPPMIGISEAIKGGIELYPGGFTAVDAQYDERLGEVLRPAQTGGERSIPMGLDMNQDTREMISRAFFLNKLNLPAPQSGDMTAFEVARRIEEYIRGALPLFEPMETDYNGQLMEQDFTLLSRGGAFGPASSIPSGLREAVIAGEIEFTFESPLHDAIERQKATVFQETKQIIAETAPFDPTAPRILNGRMALRDTLHGIQTPAGWLLEDEEMDKIQAEEDAKRQAAETLASVSAGAQVAEQVANAGVAMGEAGQMDEAGVEGAPV
jgi:hypothetical protein